MAQSRLMNELLAQSNTENSKDAQDCISIYNLLLSIDNAIWSSKWDVLVNTKHSGVYPKCVRIYKPSKIGRYFLIGASKENN